MTAATSRRLTVEIYGEGCVLKKRGQIVAMGSRRDQLLTTTVEVTVECHVVDNEA